MPVVVGTSGWQYRHWREVFYPADVPQRSWLEYFATHFATVENNNAFYRLPERKTFEQWGERTPADFVMAVKASRYLTHVRRLRDPAEPVARLLGAAAGLGGKLGPILLQLPPNLTADPQRLDECLRAFGQTAKEAAIPGLHTPVRIAVEPRHDSWWTSEVRQTLTRHQAALAWTDSNEHALTPSWDTAGWGYLRLHQGTADPAPRYGERALQSWAERVTTTWPETADVFVYFNNDPGGAAIHDAAAFAAMLKRARRSVTRTSAPDDDNEQLSGD